MGGSGGFITTTTRVQPATWLQTPPITTTTQVDLSRDEEPALRGRLEPGRVAGVAGSLPLFAKAPALRQAASSMMSAAVGRYFTSAQFSRTSSSPTWWPVALSMTRRRSWLVRKYSPCAWKKRSHAAYTL